MSSAPPGQGSAEGCPRASSGGRRNLRRSERDEAIRAIIDHGYASTGAEALRIARDWLTQAKRRRDDWAWLMQQIPGGRKPRVTRWRVGEAGWRTRS
jgi:hypothetical protein